MSEKKSDLGPRLLTALVAIPILLGVIFAGPAWVFFLLIACAGMISTWEFCSITYGDELPRARWFTSALAGVMMGGVYVTQTLSVTAMHHTLGVILAAVVALFVFFLFGYRDQERASIQLSSSLTALLYGGLLFVPLAIMRARALDTGPLWVVCALAIVWGSDTGAYFAGRAFGKHKLYEAVSPNKTIEGAVGGVLAGVAFLFAFDQLFVWLQVKAWVPMLWWQILLLAIPATMLGQIGDLCESLLKRANGVKDSGNLFPGHGGMLDRIDALIFTAPWFYYFVVTFTEVAPLPA